jgi:alanine racemase
MHRLGFYREEMETLAARLSTQQSVRVRSIFSHLAGSDEAQFDDFTHQQAKYFSACVEEMEKPTPTPSLKGREEAESGMIKHICNTAGIERFPEYHYDMCRIGIGMYGISFAGTPLRNVCTLRTTILSIKTVPAGETIGYGRHTTLTEARTIAVIPIGYADGFDRRLSNHAGEVIVRGQKCPVVGNICMDQAMIDITGTDAQVGDNVEIFGDKQPLQHIADQLGTIPYEILTSVSRRVQRVYFYE